MSLDTTSLLRWHRRGARRGASSSGDAVGVRPWRLGRVALFLVLTVAWPPSSVVRAACSNDLEGFEAAGVCCLVDCGLCGGEGCSSVPDTRDEDCCIQDIESSEILCSEQMAAPCIIDNAITPTPVAAGASPTPTAQTNTTSAPAPVASTGTPVGNSTASSSPSAAPATAQPEAATAQPEAATTAQPEAATAQPVTASSPPVGQATTEPAGPVTGTPTLAPNPPFEESTCSNGLAGVQSGNVCCMELCGQCGGEGCGDFGAAQCCHDEIQNSGVICGEEGAVAPCIINPTPSPVPLPEGETLEPATPTTAPASPPTAEPSAPATPPALSPADPVDTPTAAPVTGSREVTTAPTGGNDTSMPTAPVLPEEQLCADDVPGYRHGVVCCPLVCGQCGGAGCDNIDGTSGAECCSDKVLQAGVLCSSTVSAPCILGTADEVALDTEASNAARGLTSLSGAGSVCVACAAAVVATACLAS